MNQDMTKIHNNEIESNIITKYKVHVRLKHAMIEKYPINC